MPHYIVIYPGVLYVGISTKNEKEKKFYQVQNLLSTYLLIQKKSIFGVVFFEELCVLCHAANIALQQGLIECHENPCST